MSVIDIKNDLINDLSFSEDSNYKLVIDCNKMKKF